MLAAPAADFPSLFFGFVVPAGRGQDLLAGEHSVAEKQQRFGYPRIYQSLYQLGLLLTLAGAIKSFF